MHLSLHTKLNELQSLIEGFEVVMDPEIHRLPGEGRLMYKGSRIEYVTDYVTPREPASQLDRLLLENDLSFPTPHDVAWSPTEGVVLAYAVSAHEAFLPISEPLKAGRAIPECDLFALGAPVLTMG